jgi:hypothetical protein
MQHFPFSSWSRLSWAIPVDPGMDSNQELDRILKSRKFLILQRRTRRQKHQKQGFGTKSVQNLFAMKSGLSSAAPFVSRSLHTQFIAWPFSLSSRQL